MNLPKPISITTSMDFAGLYSLLGVKNIIIGGRVPENTFTLKATWYHQVLFRVLKPILRAYLRERSNLKYRSRVQQGLPAHYSKWGNTPITPFKEILKGVDLNNIK